MELDDFIPPRPEFTLQNGKTYTLRLMNIEDSVWIKKKFGSVEAFQKALNEMDWEILIVFIYRLLVDKSDFLASQEEIIDDDGVKSTVLTTGPFKLLRSIRGEDALKVIGAMTAAIRDASPMTKEIVNEALNDVKKNLKDQQIGQKSSTSSRRNTGGQRQKSAN